MKYSKILRFLMSNAMSYVTDQAGGGGGGGDDGAAAAAAKAASEAAAAKAAAKPGNPMLDGPIEDLPEAWREHARELRRENAALRAGAKAAEEKARAAEEKAAQEKMAAEAKAAAAEETKAMLQKEREASNKRIINSEVRSAATALGLQDPDTLKLLDTSKLTINEETGEVAGITELLAEFKKSKPFLFKEPVADTSQSRKTPPKDGAKAFDARTATKEELAADAKTRKLVLKQH